MYRLFTGLSLGGVGSTVSGMFDGHLDAFYGRRSTREHACADERIQADREHQSNPEPWNARTVYDSSHRQSEPTIPTDELPLQLR